MADRAASPPEFGCVVGIEAGKEFLDALKQVGTAQKLPISVGGDGKSIRYLDSLRSQLAIELSQRGVLATDERDVFDPNLFKPADVAQRNCGGVHGINLAATALGASWAANF